MRFACYIRHWRTNKMESTNLNRDRRNRRKTTTDFNAMAYGKVPPQSRELEEAVLGAVMLERAAFDIVINILKPECFYVDAHQHIFRAMVRLNGDSKPIDLLTVVEELKAMEMLDQVGGPYYISKLTNAVVSAANIEAHARIVQEKFIQRELIRISSEIITDAYDDSTDVFDLLDSAEQKLFEIANDQLKKEFDTLGKSVMDTLNRIDEMRAKNEDITGVPS
ncbi:MAG: replicative helicase, partial [Bacteroidota bacterium]